MPKTKVAILGGGMAGLSAAYQLSKTPALRDQYQVAVYQLGWRLGGKAASGRDARGRNLEHGLHVWFGCYENVFQMTQEVYAARAPAPGAKLATWQDAVKPQAYTPIGVLDASGKWSYFPLTWPLNNDVPGDGQFLPSWSAIIQTVIGWILDFINGTNNAPAVALHPATPPLVAARTHLQLLGPTLVAQSASDLQHVVDLLRAARDANLAAGPQTILHDVLDVFKAIVAGIFSDLVLTDSPMVSIDDRDFRRWLLDHGADASVVANSSVVRVVYDTLFQYEDGDAAHPSYAAGAALGVIMRLVGTYKGSMMWEIEAGMGEAVIAPLYEHLLDAGVTFNFFRKVTSLELSAGGKTIETIHLDVQALTDRADYQPTVALDGLTVWPSEPLWGQLQNGAELSAAGVNFESHWGQRPAAATETLTRGQDFDLVVLAISLGAYKPLNSEDGSLCAPLIAASPAFADYVNNVGIVPSLGVQLWSNRSVTDLGWKTAKAATVAGPEYLDIWADMTQVLAYEPPGPLSLHYLTGTYKTMLQNTPASNAGAPATAAAEIRQQTVDWLNNSAYAIWPAARVNGAFDWDVLFAPPGVAGQARLDQQFLRANIDPTECCTLSAAGTTQYRLHPQATGFANLFLAGEGARHGFNTTTIEGAVMSGAAAARAISGSPARIVGYDFLENKPSQGPGQ